MTKSTDGPIVDAVRRVRRQIAKECGYDLDRLIDLLQREERASGRRTRSPREARFRSRTARLR
jgi:hypothetical protein